MPCRGGQPVHPGGGTLVPTDRNGEPVCPAIVWNDTRCTEEMTRSARALGGLSLPRQRLVPAAGPQRHANRLAAKNNRPLFERTELFLSVPDYIAMKLTGKAVIDPSNAGINQLMSLEKKDWEDEILDYLGITRRQLPKIADSGAVIGTALPCRRPRAGPAAGCAGSGRGA